MLVGGGTSAADRGWACDDAPVEMRPSGLGPVQVWCDGVLPVFGGAGTLPVPLRVARAIALLQGCAAVVGLAIAGLLRLTVDTPPGLERSSASVPLLPFFLVAVAVAGAIVVTAVRMGDAEPWTWTALSMLERVAIAFGLVALLVDGFLTLVIVLSAVAVIVCLRRDDSRAALAAATPDDRHLRAVRSATARPRPVAPWEVPARVPASRQDVSGAGAPGWGTAAPAAEPHSGEPTWRDLLGWGKD